MPLDFPASPSTGATYTGPNGVVWIWDGVKWTVGTQSGAYLPLSGGTLTGTLTLDAPGYSIVYLKSPVGNQNMLIGMRGATNRWDVTLGNNTAEGGSNAGSDFSISRYNDAGTSLGAPLSISRATGNAVMTGNLTTGNLNIAPATGGATLDLTAQTAGQRSQINLNDAGANKWQIARNNDNSFFLYDATHSTFAFNITTTGLVQLGEAGVAGVSIGGAADPGTNNLGVGNNVIATGYRSRTGTNGVYQSNNFNFEWRTSTAHLWVDTVDQGAITVTCDYRIKGNVVNLPSTWDQVKVLRPISYNYKACAELLREVDDPAPRWGFLAHELQEALLPTAASGEKDAPNVVQSPDLVAVCAALTKALQEAMARIEVLEGKGTRK